jgi:transcription antitermination factor NusG
MTNTPGDSINPEWYIWTVRPGKFDIVKAYIEKSVKEISCVLCPTVTSEKEMKSGRKKTKVSLLYAGYVFLQYAHDENNPVVWTKLNKHPFVVSYVGPCTAADIALIAK